MSARRETVRRSPRLPAEARPPPSSSARWLSLETSLLLLGAEEQRRKSLRAFRDVRRPVLWDRHLVLATGPPRHLRADCVALDAYYRAACAPQWSMVGARDDPSTLAWMEAFETGAPAALRVEHSVLMERTAPPDGWSPAEADIERVGGESGFAVLESVALVESPEDVRTAVLPALLSLYVERARKHDVEALVIREGGKPVASVLLTVAVRPDGSGMDGRGWVEDLTTRPEARGRGHGRRLLRAATALAFAKGVTAVGLDALADDWTWRWYARAGFTEVGRSVRLRRDLGTPA